VIARLEKFASKQREFTTPLNGHRQAEKAHG